MAGRLGGAASVLSLGSSLIWKLASSRLCLRQLGHASARRSSLSEALLDDGEDLLDPVTEGMLLERALHGVAADGARFVGMGEVVGELILEVVEIAVGYDLFPGGEEPRQLALEIHDLAGAARRELEGARVDAHDVVHGMVMVQRQSRAGVDG